MCFIFVTRYPATCLSRRKLSAHNNDAQCGSWADAGYCKSGTYADLMQTFCFKACTEIEYPGDGGCNAGFEPSNYGDTLAGAIDANDFKVLPL